MKLHEQPDRLSDESGIGLIEIMVSMFLLALVAVAFLPLLVNALQKGPINAAIAAGNQLVADGLTQAETQGAFGCAAVHSMAAAFPGVAAVTAPAQKYDISVTVTVGTCPPGLTDYPATVDVVLTAVQNAGTPEELSLSAARQLVYVESP